MRTRATTVITAISAAAALLVAPTAALANEGAPATKTAESSSESAQLRAAIRAADGTGFPWRQWDVEIVVGCYPGHAAAGRCPWGTYDPSSNKVYVGKKAFASQQRLEYVVSHEMGHAWQKQTGWEESSKHVAKWGPTGKDGREKAADCIAAALGKPMAIKWSCPADARRHMAKLMGR